MLLGKIKLVYCLLFIIFLANCSNHPNRIDWTISPNYRMCVPVRINDSIIANMIFDSGAVSGVFRLDSAFVAAHPSIYPNVLPDDTLKTGSAWTMDRVSDLHYQVPITVTIGEVDVTYPSFHIYDMRQALRDTVDGIFNIPENDTTHVWEWNFEYNYLEIHSTSSFKMPDNSILFPFKKKEYHNFYIDLSSYFRFPNGDTLTVNQLFWIDTGMVDDVAFVYNSTEWQYLNSRKDAVWNRTWDGFSKQFIVNADLANKITIDSIRLYTYNNPYTISSKYIIGQNFLRHFNVFFDMKNKIIGLQPLKNYNRLVLGIQDRRRFHYSTSEDKEGFRIVKYIADYKENYFKTAGLQVGDKIISMNDVPYNILNFKKYYEILDNSDTLVMAVTRNGKPLKIIVPVDKTEERGD